MNGKSYLLVSKSIERGFRKKTQGGLTRLKRKPLSNSEGFFPAGISGSTMGKPPPILLIIFLGLVIRRRTATTRIHGSGSITDGGCHHPCRSGNDITQRALKQVFNDSSLHTLQSIGSRLRHVIQECSQARKQFIEDCPFDHHDRIAVPTC